MKGVDVPREQAGGGARVALDYAPAAPAKGRAARKWLVVAGAVLLIYLSAEYGPGLARQGRIRWVQSSVSSFESARTVTVSTANADDGETSANSSLSLRGFSTMPTTVRR